MLGPRAAGFKVRAIFSKLQPAAALATRRSQPRLSLALAGDASEPGR